MQIRADQLAPHLAKGLKPLYVVYGDEPLLAQEACDAIRAAARAAGFTDRQVHTVAGGHVDWASILGASQEMSLFADRSLVEIRIPSGKPGKDGSEALQRYCQTLSDDVLTLVSLPRLDRTQQSSAWFTALDGAGVSVRIDPVERRGLPQWIAQRLAAQQQQVEAGEAGAQTLAFFADRVEGNLLAAHQEIAKLGLLYPTGTLSFEQVESAVLNVARFDVFKLGEAVLSGQVTRALRMLDGLEAEGEAAVLVHWTLADDVRMLRRVKAAMLAGKPLAMALRESRVWGAKEKLVERVAPQLDAARLDELLEAARRCDGIVKGLRQPGWPTEPWAALRHLVLRTVEVIAAASVPPARRGAAPAVMPPALALRG